MSLFKLDMYQTPATAPHFAALAKHINAPEMGCDYLFLGQICGIDFARKPDAYRYLASFTLAETNISPGHYYSVIVASAKNGAAASRQSHVAINHYGSFSGDYALCEWWINRFNTLPVTCHLTGSHAASLHAVAIGAADMAAIDVLSYQMITAMTPEITERVTIIDRTPQRPALPFVCDNHFGAQATEIRKALLQFTTSSAFEALAPLLGICDIDVIHEEAFFPLAKIADHIDALRNASPILAIAPKA